MKTTMRRDALTLFTLMLVGGGLMACGEKKAPQSTPAATHPDNTRMITLCEQVSSAILKAGDDCAGMGKTLQALLKPQLALVKDFTKHSVSKRSGHKFEAAERSCGQSLAKGRKAFFACLPKEPLLRQSLRDLPALH